MPSLVPRVFFCNPNFDINCGNSGWFNFGRWILLGVIVVLFIVLFLGTCFRSRQRVRRGQTPLYGTSWMVPPSYYQSQQQYREQPVPEYNRTPGNDDAGYYDQNGNFVQHQSVPMTDQSGSSFNYGPPEGPPPGPSSGYVPPEQPGSAYVPPHKN